MAMSLYICTARAVFNVDRLLIQFCGRKREHYVERIPSWLTLSSTPPPFAFSCPELWSNHTALKDGAAIVRQHAPHETVPPSRRRFFG
jgi:hypothetical protein